VQLTERIDQIPVDNNVKVALAIGVLHTDTFSWQKAFARLGGHVESKFTLGFNLLTLITFPVEANPSAFGHCVGSDGETTLDFTVWLDRVLSSLSNTRRLRRFEGAQSQRRSHRDGGDPQDDVYSALSEFAGQVQMLRNDAAFSHTPYAASKCMSSTAWV